MLDDLVYSWYREKHFITIGEVTIKDVSKLIPVGSELANVGWLINSLVLFTCIGGHLHI